MLDDGRVVLIQVCNLILSSKVLCQVFCLQSQCIYSSERPKRKRDSLLFEFFLLVLLFFGLFTSFIQNINKIKTLNRVIHAVNVPNEYL